MKNNMKRILAFFVSINCLFTMPLLTGAEGDALQDMQTQEISQTIAEKKQVPKVIEMEAGFLTALGMIPDDVDFDSYVTREDAAAILCRMLAREDLAESYSNVSYYEDVSVYSQNVGYINVVTNEGLFNGRSETIFDPASPITYGEMAKLLVTAAGYSIQADRMGGYPDGYLSVASQLKIIKNVGNGGNTPVKWGDAVKMVYEAMYVDVLQTTSFMGSGDVASIEKTEGQNILTLYHKLFWNKGQITATPRNKLYGMGPSDNLDIGEIEIDGKLYTYDTEKLTYLDDLTGYRVEYFYRENSLGGYEVVYVSLENNDTVTIISTDIEEVYGFNAGDNGSAYLRYLDEDVMTKSEKLSLDKELSLIINDETVPNVTNAGLFPECGSVTLIDSNYDNKYDVAKVLDYDVQIVDTVSIYDKHIFFRETLENPSSTVPLVLNPVYKDVYYDITCDGEAISLNKLHEGDVVGIIESEKDDFVYYRIELLSSYIEGTVEAYSEDEVDIDGKTYKVAPSFSFATYGIELGETYKLYFDFADRLFFAEGEEAVDFEYVLIAAGLKGGGINKRAQIKVCYSPAVRRKTIEIYDLAENVKINGTRCKPVAAIEALKLKSADKAQVQSDYLQPIRYLEFNDKGEVSMIETVTMGITGVKTRRTYVGTGPYNEGFVDRAGNKTEITYETQMFYVPETMLDDDWNYSEYGEIKFGSEYYTILWGEVSDDAGTYPECVFLYHNRTSSDPSFNINYELPMLVSNIKWVYNSSTGEYLPQVETYNSGAKFTFNGDSRNSNRACFDNIKTGDIIYPALTNTSTAANVKIQLIPSGKMWSCDKLLSLSDKTLYYYNKTNQFYGRVETIRTDPRRNKCVVSAFVGESENRSVSLTGVPIYYYDRSADTVSLGTYAAIKPAEVYGPQDASRIFIVFDETDLDEQGQFRAMMAVIVDDK